MLSWHDNKIFDSHFLIYLLDLRTRCYRKKLVRCLEYYYYLCVVLLFLVLNPEHGCEQILGTERYL
jgi:hypothetical protein